MEVIKKSRADANVKAVKETTLPNETIAEQIRDKNLSKPRIISIENANNIIVTKFYNTSGNLWFFRIKNIFDNKTSLKEHNSTAKCPLLTKTLFPIYKTINIFDLGSPWRPSTLTSSQTKHLIQSTPYKSFETHRRNKEMNKKIEMNEENIEMRTLITENMNKENKSKKDREKKKIVLREKHVIQRKLQSSENQTLEIDQVASKSIVHPVLVKVSLGEMKNLLQRPNVNGDDKQIIDQIHTKVDKSLTEQKNKQLVDFLNFSDTFDVLSETEGLSNIENDASLFMDSEPLHFSKPPQHSYRRKHAVKFNFSEDSDEEEKENVKSYNRKSYDSFDRFEKQHDPSRL